MHNKNVIYLAYCTKYGEQGTGSTVSWKPRLSNYESHIKQSVHSCKIVKHFIEKCNDPIVPFKYFWFAILDVLTNTEGWYWRSYSEERTTLVCDISNQT